jgi:O-acetyl-ADP-ribose deacetylase (regulator of RNase III)
MSASAPAASAAKANARKKAENTPLENAETLRGIYNSGYEFPEWVLEQDRWDESDGEKSHKFDDTIVVYDNDDDIKKVKELVEEREPVNVAMRRHYKQNELIQNFGWKMGAYGNSKNTELYPNIGIYCHARVKDKTDTEEKNVHVMNLIGYGFDINVQPDYQYFLNNYGDGADNLKALSPENKGKLKLNLIQRYRKIWLKACYICKLKGLENLWYYGVGSGWFSELLPRDYDKDSGNFYPEIFAPAFGIDPTNVSESPNVHSTNTNENDLTIPINFCKKYGIKVLNLGPSSNKYIPDVLFTTYTTPADTLYINAWDPWSIIGNGNAGDESLDGHWGRNSNMSVLGWSMTNSKLLPDIVGGGGAKTSKILSMKEILAKIEAKDAGSSASSPVSGDTPTPLCTIDTSTNSVKNISTECQDAIFSLAPTEESKENILKKHLSVLRTDTQYASNDKLPPGSATIVDLKYYRDNYNYPPDRVKIGVNTKNKDVNSFNKEISFVIQAAPGGFSAANASKESLKNCVYNSLYLANANGVEGIAFPLIGAGIFGDDLIRNKVVKNKNELYNLLLEGVLDYFTDFKDTNKIKIVLFADGDTKTLTDDNFNSEFTKFVSNNNSLKDILKKKEDFLFGAYYAYNKEDTNITKITALVNAANTEITFNGVDGLALAFKNMLGGDLQSKVSSIGDNVFKIADDITNQGVEIKKAFKTAVDAYIAKPSAASSSSPPTPPVVKKPFADVLTTLESQLSDQHDTGVNFKTMRITQSELLYPPDVNSDKKKNLNSAEPTIEEMVKGFENAVTSDDTKFYLVACRSIQAAYDLEMKAITGDENSDEVKAAKMRAKLLLNLRKNSLLLKVQARWDYATMQPGVEPEPVSTPEEDKKKYEELQKECAKLKSDVDGKYITESAYELAQQLIPLDEKIEIDKLQKKIELYDKYLPKSELIYKPINIKEGFTCEVTQGNNNCGRAALSNFFGDKNNFTKGFSDGNEESMQNEINSLSPYDLASPRPDVINLGQICKLSQLFESFVDASSSEETTKCRTDEDYSYMVMSLALQICGFYKFDIPSVVNGDDNPTEKKKIDDMLMMCVNNKYVVGFIVLQSKSHWVNYKRVNIGSTGDLFYFINSGDCKEKQKNNTDKGTELLKLIYDYHKAANKITKVIPIIRTTDHVSELQESEKKRSVAFDIFEKANSSMSKKELVHAFKSEYLPYALQEVTNIQIWEDNSRFEIDENKFLIDSNQNNYKWKLFMKEVTSNIQTDDAYITDEQKLKVMFYLSNFPSEIISDDLKQQILNSDESVKARITQIFVDNTKENINKITNNDGSNTNLEIIKENKSYLTPVVNSDSVTYFTPSFEAKHRFYYNLNNTNTYKKSIDTSKTNYKTLIEALKKKIEIELSLLPASPGGGGFKPRHNPITNHTASKSRHNSSFKVSSSSKTKGKSHNRSHTQRVK